MLERCCADKRVALDWPVTEHVLLIFVHWLLTVRKVGASTIQTYLAGIRAEHIARGMPVPDIRTELINLIVRGKHNMQAAAKRREGQGGRSPITPDILALLKARLGVWQAAAEADKRLVWAVATICFHGAFRMGELLCKTETVFDPAYALLTRDVALDPTYSERGSKGVARFRIKSPKEDKLNRSLIVDVFGTGNNICPVKALSKWMATSKLEGEEQPAFRLSNGKPLTPRRFTAIIRGRLKGYLDDDGKSIAAHSFRIGLASMLAALGYSEKDIKAMGRWSSRAWLLYVRHPRTQRIQVARSIS
jgi:hypothetical protein